MASIHSRPSITAARALVNVSDYSSRSGGQVARKEMTVASTGAVTLFVSPMLSRLLLSDGPRCGRLLRLS
jgi:hypothetical protein